MADVFISYARGDREYAHVLATILKEKGLDVWWDWDLVGGVDFREAIHAALKSARKVIVLWSQSSVSSHFVMDEAGHAMREGKLIPIIIDDSEPPLGFGHLHTIKSGNFEADLDLIMAAIKDAPAPPPKRTSGLRSWMRTFGPGSRLGTAFWIVTFVGSIATMLQAFPLVAGVAREALKPAKPENLAVFISDDRPFATQYLAILAERGFQTEYLPLEQLASLDARQARGLVLVHSQSSQRRKVEIDDKARRLLAGRTKTVGFGFFGSLFLRELSRESMLGKVMHITETTGNLDDRVKPESIGRGLPATTAVKLYVEDKADAMATVAAYDEGSTALQGAQGIARASGGELPDPCQGKHWSVAIEANRALWGYTLSAASLTPEGRQLFGDLAVYLRDSEYASDERTSATTKPGTVSDQLGCGLTGRSFKFRPSGDGAVTATVKAERDVALILNGPFQVGYLARQDGRESKIGYQIKQKDLESDGLWSVSLHHFGKLQPQDHIPYTLALSYPYSPDRTLLWLSLAGLSLVLALVAGWQLARAAFAKRGGQSTSSGC
jgi:hypothetical protein